MGLPPSGKKKKKGSELLGGREIDPLLTLNANKSAYRYQCCTWLKLTAVEGPAGGKGRVVSSCRGNCNKPESLGEDTRQRGEPPALIAGLPGLRG